MLKHHDYPLLRLSATAQTLLGLIFGLKHYADCTPDWTTSNVFIVFFTPPD